MFFCSFWEYILKLKWKLLMQKQMRKLDNVFLFTFLKCSKSTMHLKCTKLEYNWIKSIVKNKQTEVNRSIKPRINQQGKTGNPSLGVYNDKKSLQTHKGKWQTNHYQNIDWKNISQNPDHWFGQNTSTYNSNRPTYFKM